jgi:3-oxosteroid 1-dehydrogenase
LIFDAQFRKKYALPGLLPPGLFEAMKNYPRTVLPDDELPPEWMDSFLYRANTIDELAGKIHISAEGLTATIARFNEDARKGVDAEFHRGENFYAQYFGDPSHKPNRVLGPVETPPFYAVRIDLGDLGTKGGLKTDEHAAVLDQSGNRVPGLYAIGNAAGPVMGRSYPGAGATLGSAMTFACTAAAHIADVAVVPH